MSELLGVTVEDLVETMKARRVRIPSEIGAFIALEVCDALRSGPAQVRRSDIRIAEDGSISVFAPPGSATSDQAARSIVAVLGSLLVAAGTGVPRGLVTLVEGGPTSGRWDLGSLRDDLEASLVPLNRAAARRVLSRMLREAKKPRPDAPAERASAAPAPKDGTLDDQLDDLLGGPGDSRPVSAPPPAASARAAPAREVERPLEDFGMDSLDRELDATLSEMMAPSTAPARAAAPAATARAAARPVPAEDATIAEESPPRLPNPRPAPAPSPFDDDATGDLDDPDAPDPYANDGLDAFASDGEKKRMNPLPWVLAFVAVVAATGAAFALMRPDLVDQMLGRPPPPPPDQGPTEEERAAALAEHRARFGTLMVTAIPEGTQIFMYVGHGPADALEMPMGVALEFLAIAEGRVPSRTVLPADSEWAESPTGRRFELAMQVGTEEMAEADLALGETLLTPGDTGMGTGGVGTVHVITNPANANVYVLVGFSPRAIVENVRTDDAVELLLYHEGHPVARRILGPTDWVLAADGGKTAEVAVTLEGAELEEEEP